MNRYNVNRWATIDTDRLLDLRNQYSARLDELADGTTTVVGTNKAIKAASLVGTIDALDAILEATQRRGDEKE